MTDPAQYISGRTVEEQMNSLISYVDNRAEEVAEAAVADDVAACTQAVTDARDARDAAVAAKDTAVSTVSDCVKKTPAAAQTISGYKLTTSAGLETSTLEVNGTAEFGDDPVVKKSNPLMVLEDTDLTRGTPPASDRYDSMIVRDVNDADLGGVTIVRRSDGETGTYLYLFEEAVNPSLEYAGIFNDSNGTYFRAPTPSTTAPSEAVPNIGWVSRTDGTNNLVHTNSAEEIDGLKTFKGGNDSINQTAINFNTGLTSLSDTSANVFKLNFCLTDGTVIGFIRFNNSISAGKRGIQVWVCDGDGVGSSANLVARDI